MASTFKIKGATSARLHYGKLLVATFRGVSERENYMKMG
jgi:hypothetical protein